MKRQNPGAQPSISKVDSTFIHFHFPLFCIFQTQVQQEKERFESMSTNASKENKKLSDSIAKLEEEKTRRMPPDVQGEVRRLKRENHKINEELRKNKDQVMIGFEFLPS